MTAPGLEAEDLQRLSDFLYRHTGGLFGHAKRYYIERPVADRMAATASTRFTRYFCVLPSDVREREALINAFTVNETYFYREERQRAWARGVVGSTLLADGTVLMVLDPPELVA